MAKQPQQRMDVDDAVEPEGGGGGVWNGVRFTVSDGWVIPYPEPIRAITTPIHGEV